MSGLVQAATDVMLRAQRRLEVSAVNIANVATPGFKPISEGPGFADAVGRVQARMEQGKLQATGRPLDLAIAGEGLFAVRAGDRIVHTRQGEFALDRDGRVATPQGYVLQQADGGDLVLERGDVAIAADGTVRDDGRIVARIALYAAPAGAVPAAIDGTLFTVADVEPVASPTIRQGMVEASTVDISGQMTGMMVALRQADAGGRVFQVWDDLLGRAVTTFGQASR